MTKQTNVVSISKTTRGSASRDKILACAMDILRQGGMGALSISAVCAAAEISPTSLYHHFGSKAGLMAALIERAMEAGKRRVLARIDTEETLDGKLDRYIESMREMIVEGDADLVLVLGSLSQGQKDAPEITELLVAARIEEWRMLAAEFETILGVEDGTLFAHTSSAFIAYAEQFYRESKDAAQLDAILQSFKSLLVLVGMAQTNKLEISPELLLGKILNNEND